MLLYKPLGYLIFCIFFLYLKAREKKECLLVYSPQCLQWPGRDGDEARRETQFKSLNEWQKLS